MRLDHARRLAAFLLAIGALALAPSAWTPNAWMPSAWAHEGHDHSPLTATVALPAAPRAETTSEAFELVAVARGGELIIYLDRFGTNEPLIDANVAVEAAQGSIAATSAADGTYRLAAPWLATTGHHDFIVTVSKDGNTDILTLGLTVPGAESAAPPVALGAAATMPAARVENLRVGAAILAAFAVGVIGGVLIGRRRRAGVVVLIGAMLIGSKVLAHEGEDHVAPATQTTITRDAAQVLADGSVFVPKGTQRILAIRTAMTQTAVHRRTVELPGRVIPDPDASGFVQAVVGGRLSPPPDGFPRLGARVAKGDVLAYVTPPLQRIDVSDMRQRQGELDQQISIVERRLARYETLVPSGAIARTQLEETRLELQGLRDRRASLDRVRAEPEPLRAPVDGVIADGTPVAGQIALNNAVVFHIIDPTRLWVEALSYDALPPITRASARLGDKELTLAFRGAGLADRNQSIPIHLAIEGNAAGLRAGQLVTVLAETTDEQRGVALPRTALVRNSAGQDVVFEHVTAERFEPRPVRTEPLDGQRILISQGLSAGRRIVVQGAELIDHIR